MPKKLAAAVGLLGALVLTACGGGGAAQAAPVSLVNVATFDTPTFVTGALGDPTRLYVTQRAGVIKIFKNGQQSTFVDLSSYISGTDGERGLLSMALAPDFGTTHRFYVYFTGKPPLTAAKGDVVIARLTASSADSADPATLEKLVEIPHDQQSNHNGGQLQFGPDGFLYAGPGDGGSGGDPSRNGQYIVPGEPAVVSSVNHNTMLGKLLRLDVSPTTGYKVPPDNAFGPAGKTPEIWAYGLRNPYRFSFDYATGDLLIGDVGQDDREEVDFLKAGTAAGTNFGWSEWEGTRVEHDSPSMAGFTFPVLEYGHADGEFGDQSGCSVTGGYIDRDPNLPELEGQYIYGDYCGGKVRAANVTAAGSTNDRDLGLPAVNGLVSFGEDSCGRLYVVELGGLVQRLSSSGGCTVRPAPSTVTPVTGAPVGGGTVVADDGSGSGATATPGGAVVADKTAPHLKLLSRTVHPPNRTKLRLLVSCNELCQVSASGTYAIDRKLRKALKLRRVTRTFQSSAKKTLLLASAPSTLRSVAAALRAHRSVVAHVTLKVNDKAGNVRTLHERVKVAA